MEKKEHLLIVDGMALLFRAFYATSVYGQFMINSKGIPTNAINGFFKHLFSAIDQLKPTHVICCWDMGSKTYRSELFTDYKGNRPEAPIELIPQFDLVKQAVEALDIPNIGIAGFEADDCIGTIVKHYQSHLPISVLTGDKDLLQLLDEQIQIVLLQKGIGNYKIYTNDLFSEELGIDPHMLIDVKALMGDSSDNYPGVKGIGEKTAYKLIAKYRSINSLLENLSELTKAQRLKIEADIDMLHLSRQLAEINCKVPVQCALEDAILSIQEEKALLMMEDIELRGFHVLINSFTSNKEAI